MWICRAGRPSSVLVPSIGFNEFLQTSWEDNWNWIAQRDLLVSRLSTYHLPPTTTHLQAHRNHLLNLHIPRPAFSLYLPGYQKMVHRM